LNSRGNKQNTTEATYKVVGLGKTGCGIADQFRQYPEYEVFRISSDAAIDNDLYIQPEKNIEDYEKNFDAVEADLFFKDSFEEGDQIIFALEGGDPVAGITLSLLEKIKQTKITVIYMKPDQDVSSVIQMRDDRIVYNVLQEYTRSGLFERMYILERSRIEEMVGDVPISEYEKSVYHFVAYIPAMINYFDNTGSILESKTEPLEISRLATYGLTSLEKNIDIKFLFPIDEEKSAHFYFGIPDQMLATDNKLMQKIKSQVKRFSKDGVDTGYSVHSTELDAVIVLCSFFSHKIQS
tara:strand:+ start:914 stop:1798 length:885 start_codon:yes stop_codon:yes gene_type:complete